MLKSKGMYKIAFCVVFIGASIVVSDGILVSYLTETETMILLLAFAFLWWLIVVVLKRFKAKNL